MPETHSLQTQNQQKYVLYFWLFVAIHTLLWTLGPALLRTSVTHDTLEGITWGLQWELGYSKHPFLTAWLCAGITSLFGTVGWPVYLLAQLAVLATFSAAWQLAKQILPPLHALIAALLLEGVFFYNLNSFNLTPDTMQSPLWALLALFFYRAISTQKTAFWLGVGVCAALCVCTKYQIAVLLLPMLLLCLFDPVARASFRHSGIYWALACFIGLISPHLVWLYQHDFISIYYATEVPGSYTNSKSWIDHITYPLRFVVNNLFTISGVFILLWPFYGLPKAAYCISSFQWRFLIFLGLGPLVVSLLLCVVTGDHFTPRWSTPYYFALGIIMMAYLKPQITKHSLKQFTLSLLILSTLLFAIRMISLSILVRPESDAYLPNKPIALYLEALWYSRYHTPIPLLAGSNYLVSSVLPYLATHPKPYLNFDLALSPWINEADLHSQGGLFIWDEGSNYTWDENSISHRHLPADIAMRFPDLKLIGLVRFYRTSDNKPIVIGVAVLPPHNTFQ